VPRCVADIYTRISLLYLTGSPYTLKPLCVMHIGNGCTLLHKNVCRVYIWWRLTAVNVTLDGSDRDVNLQCNQRMPRNMWIHTFTPRVRRSIFIVRARCSPLFSMALRAKSDLGRLIFEVITSRTHTHTHTVELL